VNAVKLTGAAVASEARSLFGSFSGRFAVAVTVVAQVVDAIASHQPWWVYPVRVLLAPVWLLVGVCIFSFLSGLVWALVHFRQPKTSYVKLELKSGESVRGVVRMPACCLRRKLARTLKYGGKVVIAPDGKESRVYDASEFAPGWLVAPVDAPDAPAQPERGA
jgi:hypothetical protein